MKTLIVFGLLGILIFGCITMMVTLPTLMLTYQSRDVVKDTLVEPPDNVYVALGTNNSSGVRMGKDFFLDDDVEEGYFRKSNLQIGLPSGRRLSYKIDEYGGIFYESKISRQITFRLPDTTPDLYQAVENLKTEIHRFEPNITQKCENDLIAIQNSKIEPLHAITLHIGFCNIEIEPEIDFTTEIRPILTYRKDQLVNEWIIYLTFSSKYEPKRICCKNSVQN